MSPGLNPSSIIWQARQLLRSLSKAIFQPSAIFEISVAWTDKIAVSPLSNTKEETARLFELRLPAFLSSCFHTSSAHYNVYIGALTCTL